LAQFLADVFLAPSTKHKHYFCTSMGSGWRAWLPHTQNLSCNILNERAGQGVNQREEDKKTGAA
jgi:hypothetical protein